MTVNRFTTLGTIPKPNYSSILTSSYDPYALTPVHQPVRTSFSKNTSQYVRKQYFQNLFSIEPNRSPIIDPLQLAKSYFPPEFHWIPEHGKKNLQYYSDLLRHEKSITINTIANKFDTSKIIYHSVYIANVISEKKWGSSPNETKMMPNCLIPYSYHDYITAWFRFMLHQNDTMTHSWFVNFNKHYTGYLPFWFARWWSQFGLIPDLLSAPLMDAFKLFSGGYKVDPQNAKAKFPALLHFVKCHKVPWILKWQYEINNDENALARHCIIATINKEFSSFATHPIDKNYSPIQTPAQVDLPSLSSTKNIKPKPPAKKKSSPLDDLRRYLMLFLLSSSMLKI
ncbi:hypothetical protein SO802_019992 [Lithocarpus litseifolius]|uniref:Uncharacterized protein n=1 Tax=Lithocarpus litseifolius TaxID=425828 RepID=A0AAW2CBX1_9ROSI